MVYKKAGQLGAGEFLEIQCLQKQSSSLSAFSYYGTVRIWTTDHNIDYNRNVNCLEETQVIRAIRESSIHMTIRRISISFGELKVANRRTYNLFSDETFLTKEHNLLECIIDLKDKYGKNSILKGRDLFKESTTIMRNNLIGGHNAN